MTRHLLFAMFLVALMIEQSSASEHVLLKKIEILEFEKLRSLVEKNIRGDINIDFPAHFDESQTFKVIRDGSTDLKLAPVVVNSKKAKNDVCLLAVLSKNDQFIETIPLHYVEGDADEVVESCVGVQAVALDGRDDKKLIIYLLRYRLGNNYGDRVSILAIRPGKVQFNKTLSDCVASKENIMTLTDVRKAIKHCHDTTH